MDTLNMRIGGKGEPAVLLLHGLGATGAVWNHFAVLLDRRVLVPDLPGHGPSAPLPHYSFRTLAEAVARALPDGGPLIVAGHSLGGVLALELASDRFDVEVAGVLALGVKVEWSQDDLNRAASFAARPPRVFATQEEADQAYLKVSGLLGIAPADPAGLRETEGGWRLAMDPAAFGLGAPDMPALLAGARCPVVLAAGENDPMSRPEQLRALDPGAVTLAGLGHNAHVEDPAAVRALLKRFGV
ncbi:Pimeloyl-ACP methyl ester carboxylesterase [Amycolatopsis tolypomycina]|uniref:Pimeloyl-ACP methyl ester carboxylesterase n=1 Tax=Amycolatopsis tolypomycina TaxID=208445 RepID=A0A1H4Q6V9_9PSEU|nr:alpha/beta fold hydrolase [Amycolatopsis tolypomycina]SEC15333.1 Pimeloyl-ACP methyl ester carboxylesterase [Amycolatopsis tolypomycina]